MTAELKPGREMDRAVATAIGVRLGDPADDRQVVWLVKDLSPEEPDVPWTWLTDAYGVIEFEPSSDIRHAIYALEATGMPFGVWNRYRMHSRDEGCSVGIYSSADDPYPDWISRGDTIAEAACRAILAWAEARS